MAASLTPSLAQALELNRQRFLYGLERVPEDRLGWSPGGATRTPLQLAARLIIFLDQRREMLRAPLGEVPGRAEPPVLESREAAREQSDAAFRRLISAVEQTSEDDLQRLVTAPWGAQVPAAVMLFTAIYAVGYFQGQLNYCQMGYGDEDPNIPPEWRR